MKSPIVHVIFTEEELWTLHSVVRHEQESEGKWKYPPVSEDFNKEIGEALLFLFETNGQEAYIPLDEARCLVIDYHIRYGTKSQQGSIVGPSILYKVFRARRDLDLLKLGFNTEGEDTLITSSDVINKLKSHDTIEEEEAKDANRNNYNDPDDFSSYYS